MTDDEVRKLLVFAIGDVFAKNYPPDRLIEDRDGISRGFDLPSLLYEPDDCLRKRVNEYVEWCRNRKGENPGHLMEELALLAFKCLKGWNSLLSYQSYAAQHDLVVEGSDIFWMYLLYYLHLPFQGRSILIEAKNEETPVSDSQLSRLASIMQNKFEVLCDLGVFFTRTGASGFPERSEIPETGDKQVRQRRLEYARATQILFHAKTHKFIIVLDDLDIRALVDKGALPRILEAKIRDVEEATGLPITFEGNWNQIDLPPHLRQYVTSDNFVDAGASI